MVQTPNIKLEKPAEGTRPWTDAVNGNWDKIDTAIGNINSEAAEFINGLAKKANTDLSNVSSNIDYVVERNVNSSGTWYKKYKSGWLEQGGIGLTVSADGTKTVTLRKPFKNTKYIVNWLDQAGSALAGQGTRGVDSKATTSFEVCNGQDKNMNIGWIAIGQGA